MSSMYCRDRDISMPVVIISRLSHNTLDLVAITNQCACRYQVCTYIYFILCMHDKRKPYPLIMAKSISWHLCSLRYGSISWKLQSVNSFAIIPSTFGKKQLGRTLLFPLYAVDDVGSRCCCCWRCQFRSKFFSPGRLSNNNILFWSVTVRQHRARHS